MILEVEFKKLDKALCMRVLKQSKRDWSVKYVETDDLSIASIARPGLDDSGIFLRGTFKWENKSWVIRNFPSNEARDAYHRKALRAIARARKEIK